MVLYGFIVFFGGSGFLGLELAAVATVFSCGLAGDFW